MNANDFLGLTKKRAQDLAEGNNIIFRLIKVDNENYLPYPDDEYSERICVEIENGKVSKAIFQ